MPNLDALILLAQAYGPVVLLVVATFLAVEAVFITVTRRRRERGEINARLRILGRTQNVENVLIELRRSRGLTADGDYRLPLHALNRLVLQSGLLLGPSRLLLMMLATGVVAGSIVFSFTSVAEIAVAAALAAGIILPLLILTTKRKQRIKRFEAQLPEAIDVIVRSLRAGHPVAVAVALVAREMPDPIGSEFGLASDEMTYGMDLEVAMNNMRVRAGQSDLGMLAVAISIQSKTGGNLAEILSNLSRMVRERAKMRRKVHSLSAEGRFSAIALSLIPLVICGIIMVVAPSYYNEVSGDWMFMPAVYLGLVMWACGIFVMRRMVNFKI